MDISRLMCAIVLMLVTLRSYCIQAELCDQSLHMSGVASAVGRGRRLIAHTVLNITVRGVLDCSSRCLQMTRCRSFNIHLGSLNQCELNDEVLSPSSVVVNDVEWIYYQVKQRIWSSCNNPCLNGGKPTSFDDSSVNYLEDFTCACLSGFTGRRCHITQDCIRAIIESDTLPDELFSFSTNSTRATNVRLNNALSSWMPHPSDPYPQLYVFLGGVVHITGVATQGGGVSADQWVTSYKLRYNREYAEGIGDDSEVVYMDFTGSEKVFAGNTDSSGVVTHYLDPIITSSSSLAIDVVTCHDACALRIEIYGCREEWTIAFKGVAETGVSLRDYWMQEGAHTGQLPEYRYFNNTNNYRYDFIFENWDILPINQVKLTLFAADGSEVASLLFDGRNTSSINWFNQGRLASSPWSSLTTTSISNIFSIKGIKQTTGRIHDRLFFISSYFNECDGDVGWLVVIGVRGACPYEYLPGDASAFPLIVYSNLDNAPSRWANKDDIARADLMAVYVKIGNQ